eukprot:gnl/TRDRNA2_/TRDRNA2_34425_c0_seq1.p1 gnl/TRDRNA2_/TRDRNA2_34425_c0~~gnl/TRDRNA2_/TRDRNA2_34425_c0_seq1.p1  ORF type:complete len:204 (-),score=36.17 gnl/TRDRNA2_/TRDRNA2_34425_c0_seq1:216-827(-)
MAEQDNDALLDRLTAMAPGGSALEPFLRGFQDCNFQANVQNFVAERASAFAVACPDGSHPLIWTQFHNEYRHMFEQQLQSVLSGLELTEEQLHEFLQWLKACADIFEDDTEGLYPFIQAVTSSEDYEAFLHVMFAEVRKQGLVGPAPEEQQQMQTHEIIVTVPEGVGPGQVIAVEYLGVRFEIAVPDGCGPGAAFSAAVSMPA